MSDATVRASATPVTMAASPSPWRELWLSRVRSFLREPGVVFWVFGFPIFMAVVLGLAFREKGPEKTSVLVIAGDGTDALAKALEASPLLAVRRVSAAEADAALRRGDGLVLVRPGVGGAAAVPVRDPGRPGADAALALVIDALERAAGRKDVLTIAPERSDAPGRRYIDFLVPGLLGSGLMSGGIWGVGYAIVSLRVRRLLKRLAATPMPRSAFLGSFLIHRLLVATIEIAFLLGFGWIAFGVEVHGSLLSAFLVGWFGALALGGLGLLIASRARNMETANGLMNLATIPMWILSGVFFSTGNFPSWLRPIVDALPLTALNDALRAVVNDGASLASCAGPLAVLSAWTVVTFGLALKWFRWS
jgi:ABC-2 type transport system permease protein